MRVTEIDIYFQVLTEFCVTRHFLALVVGEAWSHLLGDATQRPLKAVERWKSCQRGRRDSPCPARVGGAISCPDAKTNKFPTDLAARQHVDHPVNRLVLVKPPIMTPGVALQILDRPIKAIDYSSQAPISFASIEGLIPPKAITVLQPESTNTHFKH